MSHPIKVISFDLDDTLWPCQPTIRYAEQALFDWLGENVPAVTDHYSSDQLREKRKKLIDENPHMRHDLSELRRHSFVQLATELGLSRDWVEPAFEVFYEARQKVSLYDDVAPVLDSLRDRFVLVSLTNGNADVDRAGVGHWFQLSLNSAMVGKQKSYPDIYQRVYTEMGVSPGEMLHIGDDPLHDVSGAQSAGVKAVWINRDRREWRESGYTPDAVITQFQELYDLLDKLS